MRRLQERFAAITAVLFLALALTQAASPAAVIASIATVVLITAVAVRFGAIVVGSREMTVGARAHAHREALSTLPAPAHPSTAGRPRTRAPSMVVSAA